MNGRSPGSKLSAIASVVIIIAFFLPWVRACNQDLSGYQVAMNSNGRVEDAWVYWLTVIAPLFCLGLFFYGSRRSGARVKLAVTRLAAGIIGFLPLLNIWYNVQQRSDLEILYGGWITSAGYLGIAASFFIDLFSSGDQTPTGSFSSPSGPVAPPPLRDDGSQR